MATLPTTTGSLDFNTNTIVPNDNGTWALFTTNAQDWDSLTNWITAPVSPMITLSDELDLGISTTFTLQIVSEIVGIVSYTVYTTNDNAWANLTTTATVIASDAVNIPAFTGRYVRVSASITSPSLLAQVVSMQLSAGTKRFDILLNDIDSSSLTGTSTARMINLGRNVSHVINLQITPHKATGNNYKTSTTGYTEATISKLSTAIIVDKLAGHANIAFIDAEGGYTNSVFDAVAYVLPEQYMSGNNLAVR